MVSEPEAEVHFVLRVLRRYLQAEDCSQWQRRVFVAVDHFWEEIRLEYGIYWEHSAVDCR